MSQQTVRRDVASIWKQLEKEQEEPDHLHSTLPPQSDASCGNQHQAALAGSRAHLYRPALPDIRKYSGKNGPVYGIRMIRRKFGNHMNLLARQSTTTMTKHYCTVLGVPESSDSCPSSSKSRASATTTSSSVCQTVLQKDQEPYSATETTISGRPSSSNGLLPAQRENTMLDVSCVVLISIFRKEESQIWWNTNKGKSIRGTN